VNKLNTHLVSLQYHGTYIASWQLPLLHVTGVDHLIFIHACNFVGLLLLLKELLINLKCCSMLARECTKKAIPTAQSRRNSQARRCEECAKPEIIQNIPSEPSA
jgi:hypothetical protein